MTSWLDRPFAGRVGIVTGASRGIGRATVNRLAALGYSVVVNYAHDQRAAEITVEAILADNGAAVAVAADVTDRLDVERLFAETIEAFGGVDVVVHTVSSQVARGPMAEADLEHFDALCRTNTRATFIVSREAARQLRHGGAIVNLTSSAVGSARPNYGVFGATKAATAVLTRVLALELAEREITVNAVSLEVEGSCAPNRVADAVAYLLHDAGRPTGQVIPVDAH